MEKESRDTSETVKMYVVDSMHAASWGGGGSDPLPDMQHHPGGGSDPPKEMQHHPGGGVGRDFRCTPPLGATSTCSSRAEP